MIHRLVLPFVALLALVSSQSALASPVTERFIFGFSPDGSHFAFATYETSDAANFGFARLYVLDVANDAYVGGTPKSYGGESTGLTTGPQALGALLRDPASPLASVGIEIGNYRSLFTHHLGQDTLTFADIAEMDLHASPTFQVGELLLRLEEFEVPGSTMLDGIPCTDMIGAEAKGFGLRLARLSGAAGEALDLNWVYRDTNVPTSRFCPHGYGIADVVMPFEATNGPTIALIRFFQMGFEGSAQNFIAVPVEQL